MPSRPWLSRVVLGVSVAVTVLAILCLAALMSRPPGAAYQPTTVIKPYDPLLN